nr:tandem-95 repeat protein [Motiliproteus sp. SC1-56]
MYLDGFDTSALSGTITAVTLHLRYAVSNVDKNYEGTNRVRWRLQGGTFANTTIQPTSISGWSSDQTYNLYAQGVDTIAEIQTLDIDFTNNDGRKEAVHFDYLWLEVTYTEPNSAPTLTTITTLTGATEDTGFAISYADLAAAANEADADGDTVNFRIEAISTGTLTHSVGGAVVAGTTLLEAGETLTWTPASNANGSALNAFTVVAHDGTTVSSPAVQVKVDVAAANDTPTLTTISTLSGATEDTAFAISYADLAAAANEADVDGDTVNFRVEAISTGTLTHSVDGAVVVGTTLLEAGETLTWTPDANANGNGLNAFTVVSHDGTTVSSPAVQVKVDVGAVNDVPTISAISDPVAFAEDGNTGPLSFTVDEGGGTPEDSQTLTVTATSNNTTLVPNNAANITIAYSDNGAASADALTPTITITPAANESGTATITVTVQDNGGGTDTVTEQFTVTVNAVNDAPTITTITNQTIAEDGNTGPLSFTVDEGGGTPEDSQTLTVTATSNNTTLVPNNAANVTIAYSDNGAASADALTPTITITPAANESGTATITVTVQDNGGGTDTVTEQFTVTVSAVDDPSTLTMSQPSGQTVTPGTFNITYTLSDPEGVATVSFFYDTTGSGFSGTPIGGCADQVAGTDQICAWDTSGLSVGTYHVYGVPSDSGSSAYSAGTLTITAVDDPSTLTISQPSGQTVAHATPSFDITYTLSDPEGVAEVNFYYDTTGAGFSGTAITGCLNQVAGTNLTCTWDTSGLPGGTYHVYGVPSDSGSSAYSAGALTILPNVTPSITSSAATTATEDIQYTYGPTVSDSDGPGATWSKLGGDTCPTSTINSSTGAYAFTAAGPNPISSCTLSIQVCDGGNPNECASETVTVNVSAVNDPPTITSTASTSATEDIQYIYNATFSDPENQGGTWSKLGGDTCPSSTINSSTGAYAFTAAGPNPISSCTLSIQVCDGGVPSECASETVTVNVTAVNDPPTITSTAPTSATEDTLYSYTPAVNDPDGPATNWTVRGTDTCGGSFTGGTYNFTPAGPTPPANCQLDIQLCDGGSPDLCTTETRTVTITAVDDPSTLTVSQPSGQTVTAGTFFNITYTLSDPEGSATVTFRYDTSGSGFNGTLISDCVNQVAGTNQTCTWDTSGMPEGTYHVFGVPSDSGLSAYSAGQITITPNSAATLVVNQPDGAGDTIAEGGSFTIHYDLSDSDSVTTVAFFYDANNSGADGTPIDGCGAEPEAAGGTCVWNTSGVEPGSYYVYGTTIGDGASAATVYSSGVVTINAAPLNYASGDDGTSPGSGDSIPGVSRSGGGDDSNNYQSGKLKINVEYEFRVDFIDDSGESPVVEPRLYIAHRDSPTEGPGGDFFAYPLVCTGVTWGTGKTCTTKMKLGPAASHKFYFYAEKSDGTVIRKPSSGYADGPAIQLIDGYSLVGVSRDIDSSNYDGIAAFNSSETYGWVSAGLDTAFGATFNGNYVPVTSFGNPAETGRGYYAYQWGDTLPQLESNPDVTAASHAITLQAGWNIISNPYNGNVKLHDVQIRQNGGATELWLDAAGTPNEWIEPAIYYYQGREWGGTHTSEFGPGAELVPWMGYWMYVKDDINSYELIITKPAQ